MCECECVSVCCMGSIRAFVLCAIVGYELCVLDE